MDILDIVGREFSLKITDYTVPFNESDSNENDGEFNISDFVELVQYEIDLIEKWLKDNSLDEFEKQNIVQKLEYLKKLIDQKRFIYSNGDYDEEKIEEIEDILDDITERLGLVKGIEVDEKDKFDIEKHLGAQLNGITYHMVIVSTQVNLQQILNNFISQHIFVCHIADEISKILGYNEEFKVYFEDDKEFFCGSINFKGEEIIVDVELENNSNQFNPNLVLLGIYIYLSEKLYKFYQQIMDIKK